MLLTFGRVGAVGERLNGRRDAAEDTSQQSDVVAQCFCLGNRVIELAPEWRRLDVLGAAREIRFVGQFGEGVVEIDDRRLMMMTGGDHSGGDRNLDIRLGGERGERPLDPREAVFADAGYSPATEVGYLSLCHRCRILSITGQRR